LNRVGKQSRASSASRLVLRPRGCCDLTPWPLRTTVCGRSCRLSTRRKTPSPLSGSGSCSTGNHTDPRPFLCCMSGTNPYVACQESSSPHICPRRMLLTLSYRRHADKIAQLWFQRVKESSPSKKLTLVYLANGGFRYRSVSCTLLMLRRNRPAVQDPQKGRVPQGL
jgi:hypothetical protein